MRKCFAKLIQSRGEVKHFNIFFENIRRIVHYWNYNHFIPSKIEQKCFYYSALLEIRFIYLYTCK